MDLGTRETLDAPLASPVRLQSPQRDLVEELRAKQTQLADMYLGALLVLRQTDNPDSYAQAAHSIRELMEKLARLVAAPIETAGPSLTERLKILREKWRAGIGSSFDESIAPVVNRRFLKECDAFFEWFDSRDWNRRSQFEHFMYTSDPSRFRMPTMIEKRDTDMWMELHKYFQKVAHHGRVPERSEFDRMLRGLEVLLLSSLRPSTFDENEEIDRIIAEGEASR